MENLSNINNIKNILQKHNFTFSKALGQNFLINPSVCPRMAEYCSSDDNGVIEIGPGIGVLTNELAKLNKKVVALELDSRLIPVLNETLSEYNNVKVINADVLKIDLNEIIKTEFNDCKSVSICANLPYYITSPIIMKILEEKLPISSVAVMVQKEAAQRICAKEKSRECGAITTAVRYYAEPEILFHVSAGSFMPAPKVDSAVIRLNIHKTPPVIPDNENLFFKIIKASFAQRRKTILNSISSGLSIKKSDLLPLLQSINLSENHRAEQLSIDDFCNIANKINALLYLEK